MNSRRFNDQRLPCFPPERIAYLSLLRCGISNWLMTAMGRVSRGSPVQTAMRNCTKDEGRSFEAGSQVPASNRCKLLSSKAMVVSVAVNVGRIPPGEVERGERKRTADELSKAD
jgi:hypothetical protein